MNRTLPLVLASVVVAATAGVIAATGPAGAEPVVADASDGKLTVCHSWSGEKGKLNYGFGVSRLESKTDISGTFSGYRREPTCSVNTVDERTRFNFGYTAKRPYRLGSVRIQQTDGATVTLGPRSNNVRVLMDEGEEVTVTFRWVKPRRR